MGSRAPVALFLAFAVAGGAFAHLTVPQAQPKDVPALPSNPSASDYAYAYSPAWAASASYFEWWYFAVSEVPGRPVDRSPGVLENYFALLMVVNPSERGPATAPSAGTYLVIGGMEGGLRWWVQERLESTGDLQSHGSTIAAVRPSPQGAGPSASFIRTNATDDNLVDVGISIDLTAPDVTTSQRLGAVDPVEREAAGVVSLPFAGARALSFTLHFERIRGFGPDGLLPSTSPGTNPAINWLVYALDGALRADGVSGIAWSGPAGASGAIAFPQDAFRVYADKNWGTAYPTFWVWSFGKWVDDPSTPLDESKIMVGLGAACAQNPSVCLRDPSSLREGSPDAWFGSFFVQYPSARHAGALQVDSGNTLSSKAYTISVHASHETVPFVDASGWWEIPVSYKVTFEPAGGCAAPLSEGMTKAEVTVSLDPARLAEIALPSPLRAYKGAAVGMTGKDQGPDHSTDPFHDLEALDAKVELSLSYCRGGRAVPETAPDGTTGWPIVAAVSGVEWGLSGGRAPSAELFASPVKGTSDGENRTVGAFARSIGGGPAYDASLSFERLACAPDTGCAWQNALGDGLPRASSRDLAGGGGTPAQTDLWASGGYAAVSGSALGLDLKAAGPAQAQGGPAGAGKLSFDAAFTLKSCDLFRASVEGTATELDLSNNVRVSTYCPFADTPDVKVKILGGRTVGPGGAAGAALTFADGSTTASFSLAEGSAKAFAFEAASPQARSAWSVQVDLEFSRPDTGYVEVRTVEVGVDGAQPGDAGGQTGLGPVACQGWQPRDVGPSIAEAQGPVTRVGVQAASKVSLSAVSRGASCA